MINHLRSLVLPTCAVLLTFLAAPTFAASSSPWILDSRSAARIVSAKPVLEAGTTVLRGGVEIRLHPGWRTYGCDPGDAGVPPEFDFSASENVKSIVVRWPKPERFVDGGTHSFGYNTGVIFPLRVVPKNARKPVTLRLKLDYAICEFLCVPAKAEVDLVVSRRDGAAFDAVVSAAEARVPQPPNECPRSNEDKKWIMKMAD